MEMLLALEGCGLLPLTQVGVGCDTKEETDTKLV